MNKECRIGFLGGCINSQAGLARSRHYYTLLRNELTGAFPSTRFSIDLDSYQSVSGLASKARSMMTGRKTDVLVFFIRPFPLLQVCKLWIKYPVAGNRTSRTFHPALVRRDKRTWPEFMTEYYTEGPFHEGSSFRNRLAGLNMVAGMVFRLDRWAAKYLCEKIEEIRVVAENTGCRLICISPPRYMPSMAGNFICRKITAEVSHECLNQGFGYIDIRRKDPGLFAQDGIHFSEMGHRFLSRELFALLQTFFI